jgi:hypothetical protein
VGEGDAGGEGVELWLGALVELRSGRGAGRGYGEAAKVILACARDGEERGGDEASCGLEESG